MGENIEEKFIIIKCIEVLNTMLSTFKIGLKFFFNKNSFKNPIIDVLVWF